MKHPSAASVLLTRTGNSNGGNSPREEPALPDSPAGTRLAWIAYGAGTTLALYCHNTAVLLPALATGVAFIAWRTSRDVTRGFAWNWLIVNAAVLLLWSWWLFSVFEMAVEGMREFWIPAPTIKTVKRHVMALYGQKHLALILRPWIDRAVACLALVGLWHWRRKPRLLLFSLAIVAGVPLLTLAVSFWCSVWIERVLLWPTAAWLTLIAVGITSLRRRWLIATVIALVLAVHLGGAVRYYDRMWKPQWDRVAALAAEHVRPGDAIVFCPVSVEWPFSYSTHKLDLAGTGPRYGLLARPYDDGIKELCKSQPVRMEDMEALADRHPRIWFIMRKGWNLPEERLSAIEKMWRARNRTVERWRFKGQLEIVLARRDTRPSP